MNCSEMNNKLPEWRKALNSAVENYQSMQAWYEENPDNPSAEQDMDAAAGEIEKLIKQYGVLIVLNLLDEIDELQERRKADSEPAGYHVIKECGKVGCSVATLEEAEKTRDFWNKRWTIRPYFYTQPALVATGATNSPVTPDGWIRCSERMPNDKDYVWCWGESYGWTECDTFEGYYDWSRNKWWAVTDDVEEPASKVTHWMLLPEPPQQEVK